MYKLGELTGMAFQIKDDLFDYGKKKIGKPVGIDIKEKKMTLPLIHVLNKSSKSEKRFIINTIKNSNKNKIKVNKLIHLVKEKGGIEYAEKKMNFYRQNAIKILHEFPKNDYRDSLELMLNYVIERNV